MKKRSLGVIEKKKEVPDGDERVAPSSRGGRLEKEIERHQRRGDNLVMCAPPPHRGPDLRGGVDIRLPVKGKTNSRDFRGARPVHQILMAPWAPKAPGSVWVGITGVPPS